MQNQVLRQLTILFSVFVLFGFGCKGSAPVSSVQDAAVSDARVADAEAPDAGYQIPAGWKVYENKAWAVSVAYPGTWYYRERPPEELDAGTFGVDFDSKPVQVAPESDIVYPVMLTGHPKPLDQALSVLREVEGVTEEVVTIGMKSWYKFTFISELGDLPMAAYVGTSAGVTYEIVGARELPELEQMVSTIQLGGF